MSTGQVISDILQRGVALWVEKGKLCFRAPKGILGEQTKELLLACKEEIITFIGDGKKMGLPSYAQERLWLADQLMPGSPAYNVPGVIEVQGSLDVDALRQTIEEIHKRHEVLRSHFQMIEGHPIQVVDARVRAGLPMVDLSDLEEQQRENEVQRLTAREAQIPFDLARGPLTRFILLQLETQKHIVCYTFHHIVWDGWSIGLFVNEVQMLYRAFSQGMPSSLTPLRIQYLDFAIWQREWLKGEVMKQQMEYWRRQLEGAPSRLHLPTDWERPTFQTQAGNYKSFRLSVEASKKLKALSQEEGATLFMVMMAAFNTVLFRISGQSDIVVGTTIANRTWSESEKLIGFFVNTLAFRTRFTEEDTFLELVRNVRRVALEAYANQDVPFEKLLHELRPERQSDASPIFQVVLSWYNAPQESLEIPELSFKPIARGTEAAKYDLTLMLAEGGGGISGNLEYNRDLFSPGTISHLLSCLAGLCEEVAMDPAQKILDYRMGLEATQSGTDSSTDDEETQSFRFNLEEAT